VQHLNRFFPDPVAPVQIPCFDDRLAHCNQLAPEPRFLSIILLIERLAKSISAV
jgi:hypothetical protein